MNFLGCQAILWHMALIHYNLISLVRQILLLEMTSFLALSYCSALFLTFLYPRLGIFDSATDQKKAYFILVPSCL